MSFKAEEVAETEVDTSVSSGHPGWRAHIGNKQSEHSKEDSRTAEESRKMTESTMSKPENDCNDRNELV